jgi:hypothetical protein
MPSEIERIRGQVMSSLRRESTNPTSLAGRKFLELAFGDHPYGRSANGTLETVPTINVADLRDYTARVIARDTLRIAVVGDVDPTRSASCSTRPLAACRPRQNCRGRRCRRRPSRRSAPSFRSTCRRPW